MESTKLLSYHGSQKIKDAHIAQLQAHYNADEIVQGNYWEYGKGCDTGCSFHSSDHRQWEIQLGIPLIIGNLRDRIFEGLPNADAKEFPLACSLAIPVGKDLSLIWCKLMIWLLVDEKEGVLQYAKTDAQKKAIQDIADAFSDSLTKTVSRKQWQKLRAAAVAAAADAATLAAVAAAADAATLAAAAAAADAATLAAAAAAAATLAADAATLAAAAYAYTYAASTLAAYAAAAAAAAADAAAKQNKYKDMRDKLIQLLKDS